MNILYFSFLFFLPAGIANMVPIFAAKLPFLSALGYPIDCTKRFRGKRILGDHKTFRGFVVGVIAGIGTSILISRTYPHIYDSVSPIAIGFLLSFGALAGDSVKSFFKRQANISAGKTWFPFDQIDYIVGGLSLSVLLIRLPLVDYVVILLLYFILHLASTTVGFVLQLKESVL